MKIIHITTCKTLSAGQRKQLIYESEAAGNVSSFKWDVLAYHTGKVANEFERKVPKVLSFRFLRNIYFWFNVIRLSKKYDYVLHRHICFDPFSIIFSRFIKNRVSVHHSKEIEELKLIRSGFVGRAASMLEELSGKYSLNKNAGILGVTREIAEYECAERGLSIPFFYYPNGVSFQRVRPVGDEREDGFVNAVFMCGKFSKWHGLDILIDSLLDENGFSDIEGWCLHLIGDMSAVDSEIQKKINSSPFVKVHGYLPESAYEKIIETSDVGIGSCAMWRENLSEGATLKVRELLAMGVPVLSGHRDTSIPEDFAYYKWVDRIGPELLKGYGLALKGISREKVREESKVYVEKQKYMENVVSWVRAELG